MKKARKLFVLFMAALSVSTVLSSSALAETNSSTPSKQSLVALGDSISFGYNLGVNNNHPSKEAFPYLIASSENLRVRDLAEPGWTTADLLNALNTSKYQEALKKADQVTLDIGSNDLLHAAMPILNKPSQNVTMEDIQTIQKAIAQIKTNLPTIVQKIRELTPAPIVIYTVYNPFPAPSVQNSFGELFLPAVNYIIQTTAVQAHLQVADAYTAFKDKEMQYVRVLDNDVHPTVEGQQVLAALALQALQSSNQSF